MLCCCASSGARRTASTAAVIVALPQDTNIQDMSRGVQGVQGCFGSGLASSWLAHHHAFIWKDALKFCVLHFCNWLVYTCSHALLCLPVCSLVVETIPRHKQWSKDARHEKYCVVGFTSAAL
jgi:hypothetical protein